MKNKIVLIFGGAGKLGIQFERILSSYGAKVYILDKKLLNINLTIINVMLEIKKKFNLSLIK